MEEKDEGEKRKGRRMAIQLIVSAKGREREEGKEERNKREGERKERKKGRKE